MKKLLSWLLALALCLSLFPTAALAEEDPSTQPGGLAQDDSVEEPAEEPVEEPAEEPAEEIAPDVPGNEPDAQPPTADEPQDSVASGDCGDDLIWTLNSEGVLTIAGTGEMWDFAKGASPWNSHRSEIKTLRLTRRDLQTNSGLRPSCKLS